METSSGAHPPDSDGADVNPAVALATLHQSKQKAEADFWLDYGPWWYVPVISLLLASYATVIAHDVIVLQLVNSLVLLALIFHDRRRRRVFIDRGWSKHARSRPGLIVVQVGLVLAWAVGVIWARVNDADFFPVFTIVGFALTLIAQVALRAYMERERSRVLQP